MRSLMGLGICAVLGNYVWKEGADLTYSKIVMLLDIKPILVAVVAFMVVVIFIVGHYGRICIEARPGCGKV